MTDYEIWLGQVEKGLGYALDSRTEAEAFDLFCGWYSVVDAITYLNE